MGFRSDRLADRTLNLRSGPGLNPVLAVREPDRGQSRLCWWDDFVFRTAFPLVIR